MAELIGAQHQFHDPDYGREWANEFVQTPEADDNIFKVRKKVRKENVTVSKRKKRTEKRKTKIDEPVAESNVDNWFFKNFGLAKLFDDGEDQSMD